MKSNELIIAEIIDYLVANHKLQPDLELLAHRSGYESSYFQKLFKEKVGISPKRLVQYMNMRHAKDLLENGSNILDVTFETGLSSSSRLHHLCVSCEGMTPGSVQNRGKGVEILYGLYPSVIGQAIIAKTDKGVCWLGFLMENSEEHCVNRIQQHWPAAILIKDNGAIMEEAEKLMQIWDGRYNTTQQKLKLDLYGTNFQLQVWQALLRIPFGETVTYNDIANDLGRPKSSRAVGNAVGSNPVSLLIPCHRVIRSTGIIDNYGWGSPRKKLILAMEGRDSAKCV